MIRKTLRKISAIFRGPMGPQGPAGAPDLYDEPLRAQVEQITEALGGFWRTKEGDLIPFKLLTDTHIDAILEGDFGSCDARYKLRTERYHRTRDDQYAQNAGRLSQRDRIKKLEFFAKKAVVPTTGFDSLKRRVSNLELTNQAKDSTTERIEAMAGELLSLRRQVKELKEINKSQAKVNKSQAKGNATFKGPHEHYEILTKAQAKREPDTLYLSLKEHESNMQGHKHPPRTYNERVEACKAGQIKAALDNTPYSYLNEAMVRMQADRPFLYPTHFPRS